MQYSRLSRWRRQRSGTGVKMSSTYYGKSYHIISHHAPFTQKRLFTEQPFTHWRFLRRYDDCCPKKVESPMSAPLHHPRSPSSLPVPAPVSFPTSLSKACCDLLTPPTALGTCGASEATCERSWLGSHSRVRWRRQRWETGSKCGAISETEICFSVLLLRYQSRPHVPSKGHKWKHISCITDSTRIHNHESWSIM